MRKNGKSSRGDKKENEEVGDDLWTHEEVNHLTRSGRHFKSFELERDYPVREINKGKGVIVSKEEEEDRVLKQLKKTQANIYNHMGFTNCF